jgi:RHS repeat-associated protein
MSGSTGYGYAYDFFEKDHLGNSRMVLTQERDTTNYIATMEAAYRATETQLFGNIASTSVAFTSIPNYQNIPSATRYQFTNPNDSVSKVDYTSTAGQTTGPSLLLKVMAGDTVTPGVQCYYASNTLTTTNSSFSSVLGSLASGIMGTATGAAEGTLSGYTSSSGTVYSGLTSFLSTKDQAPSSGYPKAYLNWILLDDQFNYVSGSSGSVATASTTYPANQMNTVAPGGPVVMGRNGYLYVWVSNETQGWDVFFDNFSVQYKEGPVLEENHYYPFGLTMAGVSDKAVKTNYTENKYRFNGKELQHQEFSDGTGLEEYDFGARFQDPQLGVWHGIDPLAEKMWRWSPYSYGADNPVKFVDIEGLTIGNPDDPFTKEVQDLLSKTKSGRQLWKALSSDKRAFYFESVGGKGATGWQKSIAQQMGNLIPGATMPMAMFQKWQKGDYEEVSKYLEFNQETGHWDKTKDWDQTAIVLNMNGIQQEGAMMAVETGHSDQMELYEEAALVNNAGHEGQHGLQTIYDLTHAIYDSQTKTYRQGLPWKTRNENGQYIQPQEKNADYKGRQIRDEFLQPGHSTEYFGSAGQAYKDFPVSQQ